MVFGLYKSPARFSQPTFHFHDTTTAPDSVSRWIVKAIQSSTPNWPTSTGIVAHANDTRAAITSWAYFKWVPLMDILQADAWKIPSTFLACYLRGVLQSEGPAAAPTLLEGPSHRWVVPIGRLVLESTRRTKVLGFPSDSYSSLPLGPTSDFWCQSMQMYV